PRRSARRPHPTKRPDAPLQPAPGEAPRRRAGLEAAAAAAGRAAPEVPQRDALVAPGAAGRERTAAQDPRRKQGALSPIPCNLHSLDGAHLTFAPGTRIDRERCRPASCWLAPVVVAPACRAGRAREPDGEASLTARTLFAAPASPWVLCLPARSFPWTCIPSS